MRRPPPPSRAGPPPRGRGRPKLLTRIGEALGARNDEIAEVISHEVGMPMTLSGSIQVGLPAGAFGDAAKAAETFEWEEEVGNSLVVREPVGVVGAITPWNYPLYQVVLRSPRPRSRAARSP